MFTIEDGELAVKIARETIECYVKNEQIPNFKFPEKFEEKSGVFVTINTVKHKLRGCIGYALPYFPLIDALVKAAKSATRDPRFPPLTERELNKILVEVSLLTPPELIKVKKPQDYLKEIKIGRDGLIVERGMYKGLLLPQVPIEWNWDVETFLVHACMKAGLVGDCWFEKNTKIYRFQAQVFAEKSVRGKAEERKLI